MLKMTELLNSMDSMYHPMLKEVNIAEFTKTVAIMANIHINDVSNDAILDYLQKWAKGKYKFYKMLGEKLHVEIPISYFDGNLDIENRLIEVAKMFPVWAPWILGFRDAQTNKVSKYDVSWTVREYIENYFNYNIDGSTITHFFKRYLNAPDEVVTELGKVFENQKTEGIFTISIDPVDMMLASENPYDWHSCYRLTSCHSDGPLAAVIDSSSLITYIYSSKGKLKISSYEFKNVRYKKIREWISVHPDFKAVHFNEIYPGKYRYGEDFRKQLRLLVEDTICEYTEDSNKWKRNSNYACIRMNPYGYREYDNENIFCLEEYDDDCEEWEVFDKYIICPCGCGTIIPGSDCEDWDFSEYHYNEDGITCHNFTKQHYCEYADDYCSHECCEKECSSCYSWQMNHPTCELDNTEECEEWHWDYVQNGVALADKERCEGCPMWEAHCKNKAEVVAQEEKEPDLSIPVTISAETFGRFINLN